ncbi:MAG: hypothetical protein A2W91_09375 [Bacteroidetes bacterium GWF2_38_335]|nr:MAG: hypothetical protein A2W91_09375 [Bacteroidetes bacterium GWF2_38_335]OFY80821.1 MAG: hypothetical protein A2281_09125 [Bacteroidetes bacterium RIFOXYA12_FULL_38_20]HBS86222.1 thioredoxin [Bacteroidales bacterium]
MRKIFFTSLLLGIILFACDTNKSDIKIESVAKIEVYNFYGKHRCVTCIEIEKIAKETIEKNFQKQVESKEVAFITVDMSEDKNQALIEKFEVTSSSLIIRATIDGKEEIVDLTELGFMNAVDNPEVLEKKIIDVINSFLK